MLSRFEFQIGERFHGARLDEFLYNEFEALSKAYIRRVVSEGGCQVNGYVANRGVRLRKSDFIEIWVDIDREKGMRPEPMPLGIVHEDEHVIVVEKPTGVLVHPTHYERNGTLLNGLTHYLNREGGELFIRPHPIHRLDRETSGLILAAKDQNSSRILSGHFRRRLFEKGYLALVEGRVEADAGTIDAPIERDAKAKKWKVTEGGKPSRSRFVVVGRYADRTLLELEPVTGRTNQLRLHCDHIGHPIVGDRLYGSGNYARLCLHASRLGFHHPGTGKRLTFESPLPDDIRRAFENDEKVTGRVSR